MELADAKRSIVVVIDLQGKLMQMVHRPRLVIAATRRLLRLAELFEGNSRGRHFSPRSRHRGTRERMHESGSDLCQRRQHEQDQSDKHESSHGLAPFFFSVRDIIEAPHLKRQGIFPER